MAQLYFFPRMDQHSLKTGHNCICGLPWWLRAKESPCSSGAVEDPGSIPGSGRPLEKEMATHSSILAWEIPWTEEPGGLQSIGSQRAGHT